ncbi:hypothetical protein C5167_050586 [Papaver somniferum]|uniref:EF-hand domain-containing protein n=1 Tax=Papaver somniferum TaxID=3469 RepID=A0A4Y7KQH0_PAPSO|nr:calumenin-B-like [Papaver somniferum]RZC75106.1 hypothetical protein C5167_050586 [Papaver somniferum]
MGKVSVVIYISVALLLLFLISHSPKKHSNNHHRRLKLRSTFKFSDKHHEPVPFDPIIADIERRREDREWERQYFEHNHKDFVVHHDEDHPHDGHDQHHDQHHAAAQAAEGQPEWGDFMNAEDYVNDEDRFNVTNRILSLFPKIDFSPADGFITESELTDWNLNQAHEEVMHRTDRDLELHDKNRDGFVSFAEYEAPTWVRNADNNSFGYDMGWWREEHFNASDADGDGLLNQTEFNDFLHPADSSNPKLIEWLCKEEVRERDTDKDGKLNYKEFFHGMFDLVRNYDEEGHNATHHSDSDDSMQAPARVLFQKIDLDGDGFLSDKELLPIIGKLHPSERYYAKQQADYTISQADSDKDGRLSLAEMIDNPYVFYSSIFNDEEDYEYHDEFR